MSMTEEALRHATGSAVPGGVPNSDGTITTNGPPSVRAPQAVTYDAGGKVVPDGGRPAPQQSAPRQSTTPARSEARRGVTDTPSAPVRHSAMPANASNAPSRDDELKSSIDGWEGSKGLDYWKLKAESADRAAKRARGIDPDGRQRTAVSSGRSTGRSAEPSGEGFGGRPGNSSSGGSSGATGVGISRPDGRSDQGGPSNDRDIDATFT